MVTSQEQSQKKTARIGPFELVDELGVGGVARILRARYRPGPGEPDELPIERGTPVVLRVMRRQMATTPEEMAVFSRVFLITR